MDQAQEDFCTSFFGDCKTHFRAADLPASCRINMYWYHERLSPRLRLPSNIKAYHWTRNSCSRERNNYVACNGIGQLHRSQWAFEWIHLHVGSYPTRKTVSSYPSDCKNLDRSRITRACTRCGSFAPRISWRKTNGTGIRRRSRDGFFSLGNERSWCSRSLRKVNSHPGEIPACSKRCCSTQKAKFCAGLFSSASR